MQLKHFPTPQRPRATVLIAHGYAEHHGRYLPFIEALNDAGIEAYTYDHRGHGAAAEEGKKAQVDVATLVQDHLAARRELGSHPLVLFGHSMGGLITARSVQHNAENVQAVMLSGPAFLPETALPLPAVRAGRALAKFFPGLPAASLDAAHTARDPQAVAKYQNDPLNYLGKVPLLTGTSMMLEGHAALAGSWPSIPTLILHGTDDHLANPQGSKEFAKKSTSIQLELQPGGYHEILNDYGKEEVTARYIEWLTETLRLDHGEQDGLADT